MNEEKFFVNNTWLTWDEVHNLGYTRDSTTEIPVYDSVGRETILMMDTSDHTIYDSVNHIWLNDIDTLDVYFMHYAKTMYLCSESLAINIYSKSIYNDAPSYTIYSGSMQPIDTLYSTYGITARPCQPYLRVDGRLLSWYDPVTDLYWDNRDNKKEWSNDPPTVDTGAVPEIIKSKINHELLRLSLSAVEVAPNHDISSLLSSLTRSYANNMYVNSTTGSDINGVHYNYGDVIPVTAYVYSDNLNVVRRYQSEILFNDQNLYDQAIFYRTCSMYQLIDSHPYYIFIGQTKTLPTMYESMPDSSWFWCGGFSSGATITATASSRWYNSSSYAQYPFPSLDGSSFVTISETGKYTQGRVSNGTIIADLSAVRMTSANSSVAVYARSATSTSLSPTANNNTIIVKCNNSIVSNTWPLPPDLYTLDGRRITWNTESMYYNIFYGLLL